MDLVSNVMLGKSPTPQKGAPAVKGAGQTFAALLPHHVPAEEGDAAQASVNKSGKNGKAATGGKTAPETSQLATLNIPLFIPQVAELQKSTNVLPGDAISGSVEAKPGSQSAVPSDQESTCIAEAVRHGISVTTPDLGATENSGEAATVAEAADGQKVASAQSAAKLFPAIKGAAKGEKTAAADSIQIDKPETSAIVDAKRQKPVDLKAQKANEPVGQESVPALSRPAVASGAPAKTIHTVEAMSTSAVKAALKQTLPAQTKLAGPIAKASSSFGSNLAAEQNASDPRAIKSAAATHDEQAPHDQPKKQNDAGSTASTSLDQPSTQNQLNAAGRAPVTALNSASPRQAPASVANVPSGPIKPEAPVVETPVLSGPAVGLHSARLLESLGQSELRVGMKMGDLGNVEIRTQLHHDQLRAEISVERGDLSHTLAGELPGLQQRLREHEVQATIVINHQAAAGSGSFERGSQQQEQSSTRMAHAFGVEPVLSSSSPEEIRGADSALDVRI